MKMVKARRPKRAADGTVDPFIQMVPDTCQLPEEGVEIRASGEEVRKPCTYFDHSHIVDRLSYLLRQDRLLLPAQVEDTCPSHSVDRLHRSTARTMEKAPLQMDLPQSLMRTLRWATL